MENKKGQMTLLLVILLIALFIGAVLLFLIGIGTTKINNSLDLNISVGQVNLAEQNANTFGKFNEMVVTNADWWGVSLIFGLILGLFLSSYYFRNTAPKWTLILDIFIIIVVFIISLYISSIYETFLESLAAAGETFLEDSASKTSMFILNLPVFIVIIGCVMMIIFHASIPKRTEERIQEGGFLQGVQ